jgi:hypothetical protein
MRNLSLLNKVAVFSAMAAITTGLIPAQSHAIVGLSLANVPLIVIGGSLAVGGGIGTLTEMRLNSSSSTSRDPIAGLFWTIADLTGAVIGLVLLDDQKQVNPQFQPLNDTEASKLSLTPDETRAYNAHLDEINGINQTIIESSMKEYQVDANPAHLGAYVDERWSTDEKSLPQDAQSALDKVRADFGSKLASVARH